MKGYLFGYKVVRVRWEAGKQCYKSSHRGDLIYKTGEKTVPLKGNGPLCVFTCYVDASKFRGGSLTIKPCRYWLSRATKVWTGLASMSINELPKGKALATAVQLTRWYGE